MLIVFEKSYHYRGQKVMARSLILPKYITRLFTFKIRREALGFKMPVFPGSLPLSHLEPTRAQVNRPWTLSSVFTARLCSFPRDPQNFSCIFFKGLTCPVLSETIPGHPV